MRAVIYARYSSDLQRDASIEDQIEVCSSFIASKNWSIGKTYSDRASSGSTKFRPHYQQLLTDARNNQFDIVVAEALDRLSRDQEDVAALFKALNFSGIKLMTLIERVTVHPREDGSFEIELEGELTRMIEVSLDADRGSKDKKTTLADAERRSVKVVAGAGFEPAAFRL